VGLEGGLNQALTMAENQLSNPEIIGGSTKFIYGLPPEYIATIGIDEVDKIDTG